MENKYANYRIVADSAADLFTLDQVPFAAAPLKVITAEREFVDEAGLDVAGMVDFLKTHNGRSSSSCPNTAEWLQAFGEAEHILAVTLTSGLSGSYNAARAAGDLYEAEHPGRRVFVVDSLSAGPGETLLVEKLEELVLSGLDFDGICREIKDYQKKTGLIFMLESLTNFANNGRVSPALAKIAGLLGICVVGKASEEGTLEPMEKCRGQKRAIEALVNYLKKHGFRSGKIRIAHCFNESGALTLKEKLREAFHSADIRIHETRGLCSFYAERGGLLLGFSME